ncbi:hypothetical protein ACOMHN_046247 [Nucella lapillus]
MPSPYPQGLPHWLHAQPFSTGLPHWLHAQPFSTGLPHWLHAQPFSTRPPSLAACPAPIHKASLTGCMPSPSPQASLTGCMPSPTPQASLTGCMPSPTPQASLTGCMPSPYPQGLPHWLHAQPLSTRPPSLAACPALLHKPEARHTDQTLWDTKRIELRILESETNLSDREEVLGDWTRELEKKKKKHRCISGPSSDLRLSDPVHRTDRQFVSPSSDMACCFL